jgi:hypothetical protein
LILINGRTLDVAPHDLREINSGVPALCMLDGSGQDLGKYLPLYGVTSPYLGREPWRARAASLLRLAAGTVGRTDTAPGAFYRRLSARIGKAKAIEFAAEGKIRGHIHTAKLDDINRAFSDLKAGTVDGRMVMTL